METLLYDAIKINYMMPISGYLVATKNWNGYKPLYRDYRIQQNRTMDALGGFILDTKKNTLKSNYFYLFTKFSDAKKEMQLCIPLQPAMFKIEIKTSQNDKYSGFVMGKKCLAIRTVKIPLMPILSFDR